MAADRDGSVAPAEPTAATRLRELLDEAAAARDQDPTTARQLALQARVVARAEGDAASESEALYRLASIAYVAGDPDDAFALAFEAADLAAASGTAVIESWAYHLTAIIHYQASNYSEGLEHALRAVEVCRASDNEIDESDTLNTIAAIYQSMGDDDRAIVTYESALAVSEPHGRSDLAALVYGNIARIRASRSEYLPAVSLGRRAVELARQHYPEIVSNLLADLAESYVGLEDYAKAAECFADARREWDQRLGDGSEPPVLSQLGVLLAEGRIALRRDALEEAIGALQRALELAHTTESREFELEINDLLATAFKRSGRFEEALARREDHHARYREIFTHATDLRVRTLQVAHETATARHEAEIFRLRSADDTDTEPARLQSELEMDSTSAQLDAFERLAILAEFRDANTGLHTKRVGDMAAEIAHAIGEPPDWCERLRLAARLHDIGKVAVPDAVLLKTGPLTVEEFELMKTHTTVGHQILAGSSSPLFLLAAELALTHHEWWDGSGYPHGEAGHDIPLSGRIVAVADVFDALCSLRTYKRAWPMAEAARFVISGRGVQFDNDLVAAFSAVLLARHPELKADLA